MALLTFRCASCGIPLQCQEGAGELFRCPHCEHVGTVPRPFLNAPLAAPRPERPVPSREDVPDRVCDKGATQGWRWTARGLRFIRSSLLALVLFTGVILVIDAGAIIWMDDPDLAGPVGPTAAAFILLTMIPLGILVLLQELFAVIGQCMCVCVPPGGARRFVAGAAILSTVVLWTAGVVGSVLFYPKLQQHRPGAPPPGDVIAWYAALNLISFLRWLATVDFAKLVARAMGDKRTARSASLLMLTAAGLCFLGFLAIGIPLFIEWAGNPPDRPTVAAILWLMGLIALGVIVLFFAYLSVLRRTYLTIETSLKRAREAGP